MPKERKVGDGDVNVESFVALSFLVPHYELSVVLCE